MNVKQRMLLIRLADKIEKNKNFATEIGVDVNFKTNNIQKESVK